MSSAHETDDLRRLLQRVQINTLALKSLKVEPESYAPMLLPVLKKAIPSELSVQSMSKEAIKSSSEAEVNTENNSTVKSAPKRWTG